MSNISPAEFNFDTDLVIHIGGKWEKELIFYNIDGTVRDLTNHEFKMMIKEDSSSEEAIFTFTSEGVNANIVIDEVNGKITLTMLSEESSELEGNRVYFYDLFNIYPDLEKEKELYGTIETKSSITTFGA